MDEPDYIQFLVNPDKQILVIRGCGEKDAGSQKTYWTVLKDNRLCCEFYSTEFIDALQGCFFAGESGHALRVKGRYFPENRFAVFEMKQAVPILSGAEDSKMENAECS